MAVQRGDAGVSPAWFATQFQAIEQNVTSFFRGKDHVVTLALTCLLSEGHLLIEDVPGLGKTSLAKALAASIDGSIRRLQCTPDLMPMDVTGTTVYVQDRHHFEFHPGPVFANVVLVDEINRASPKTQSALLEVMEERQVTIDSVPYTVQRPFIVIATQNPIEHHGTYPLPEAQIDRFAMKLAVGYPSAEAEMEVMANRALGHAPEQVQPVVTAEDMLQMIDLARQVHVSDNLRRYIVDIATATRSLPDLRLGVSPRGSLALEAASRVRAAADQRTFVTPEDVRPLVGAVFAHRMILEPGAELRGVTADRLLGEVMAAVAVPLDTPRFA